MITIFKEFDEEQITFFLPGIVGAGAGVVVGSVGTKTGKLNYLNSNFKEEQQNFLLFLG